MENISVQIETFACEMCGYYQNQDPFTPGVMQRMFPEFPGIPDGTCPACYSGRNPERVQRICQLSRMVGADIASTAKVASDADLESHEVEELDANGQPIMVQTRSRWELSVDQATGKVGSVEVPVYEPKMRSLTNQELAELKEQRDRNLDALESVAVKEVSE